MNSHDAKPEPEKTKQRRSLAGKVKDEPDPAWRRFFMEIDNRRKALTDRKKKPLVVSSYKKDGREETVVRQQSDPTEIKKLLKKNIVKTAGSRLAGDLQWLREIWPKMVDAEMAAATEVYAFKNGTLTIAVSSSALLQEIRQFHHGAILQDLRDIWQASIPLGKIVYRIGKARS